MERLEMLGAYIIGGVSTGITAEHSTTSGSEYRGETAACQ
jgi:hypothetical protein